MGKIFIVYNMGQFILKFNTDLDTDRGEVKLESNLPAAIILANFIHLMQRDESFQLLILSVAALFKVIDKIHGEEELSEFSDILHFVIELTPESEEE